MRPSGKKVAVVGGGPAGLTAGYYLAYRGHEVVLYEQWPQAGGMMRLAIPEYRLPPAALNRDIDEIKRAGVKFRFRTRVGADDFARLAADHDAVFIATGAHGDRPLDVPGQQLAGIVGGLRFLRERTFGTWPERELKDRQVVVLGGGSVAMHAARVARRLGAARVTVVSVEPRRHVPAYEWDLAEALAEDVHFELGWGVQQFQTGQQQGGQRQGGRQRVSAVRLKRCKRVYDEDGNYRPTYDGKTVQTLPADAVIVALGRQPSSAAFEVCGLRHSGTIAYDEGSLSTRLANVFVGGDVATGPKSVIAAVAMGRQAAARIDQHLGGDGDIAMTLRAETPIDPKLGPCENFAGLVRPEPEMAGIAARRSSFELVEKTYSSTAAASEAGRCARCDLRLLVKAQP